MVREFENKNEWAIILGASSGLGLATAKKLAKEGHPGNTELCSFPHFGAESGIPCLSLTARIPADSSLRYRTSCGSTSEVS